MWNTSLWDYKLGEFRQFINTINPKSTLVTDAFADCRELPCFPQRFRNLTIQELSADPNLIEELYNSRQGMQSEAKYKLGCKPKVREKQLINSLDEIYQIDIEKAKAKVVLGRHINSQQSYCYALEVAIAPRTDVGTERIGEVEIIDTINDLTSSDGGGTYFDGGNYYWIGEKGKQAGLTLHASTIRGILDICGFNRGEHISKIKKPCVLFINLRCRVIDWLGAKGKTQINTEPFARDIVDTVSKLAYKMPSYHGHGLRWTDDTDEDVDGDGEYVKYLKDFLIKRRAAIEADPSLTVRDRLTQSGVWYRIRPIMIEDGFKPRNKSTDLKGRTIYDWGTTRKGLTGKIRKTIEELWPGEDITREYLGIVAKARAMMYFNGQVFPVSFDSKEELANTKTTDLIVVEKEGITDVLLGAAQRYRIALVATAGKFTDYVQDLMRLAVEAGLNVWILTDYDIHGINIWRDAKIKINRLGIDREAITWFQHNGFPDLEEKDVEEEYEPNPSLFKPGDDPYLRTKRIELDSIIQKVGADAFWRYFVHKLSTESPGKRDYRDIVPEPDPKNYYPREYNEFADFMEAYTKSTYADEWSRINDEELAEVDGLLDVEKQQEMNDQTLKPIAQNDEGMKTIAMILKELMDSKKLPKVKQSKAGPEKPKEVSDRVDVPREEPRLKEGVQIHVAPEYDIGVFKNESNSSQNLHVDSTNKIDEKEGVGFDLEHSVFDEFGNLLGPEDDELYKPHPAPAIVTPITIKKSPPKDPFFIPDDDKRTISEIVNDILFKPLDNIDLPPKLKALKEELQTNLKAGDEFIQRIPEDQRAEAKRQILKLMFSKMAKKKRRKSQTNLHVDFDDKIDKKWLGGSSDA